MGRRLIGRAVAAADTFHVHCRRVQETSVVETGELELELSLAGWWGRTPLVCWWWCSERKHALEQGQQLGAADDAL